MPRFKPSLVAIALALGLTGLTACVAAQRVSSAIDCNGICNRYSSCFSTSYDVSACADRCRDSAAKDVDYRRKADSCNACISDRACASAAFACGAECISVVP
ncbi:MAG: hypothetical protein ACYC8T_05755 [Myxococcaceae bacterium]